jgi:hypothetical protein
VEERPLNRLAAAPSLSGVFAAAIANELIERVDFPQSFVQDLAGPRCVWDHRLPG